MKKKSYKGAVVAARSGRNILIAVIVSLLSVALLGGVAFAWYTYMNDNEDNKIETGSLSGQFLMFRDGKYADIGGGTADIYNENSWRPGSQKDVYLAVKNTGSVTFNYQIYFQVEDGGLSEALELSVATAAESQIPSATFYSLGTVSSLINNNGEVTIKEEINVEKGETRYIALKTKLLDSAGNSYAGKSFVAKAVLDITSFDGEDKVIRARNAVEIASAREYQTVVLQNDITASHPIVFDRYVNIDLNGYKFTGDITYNIAEDSIGTIDIGTQSKGGEIRGTLNVYAKGATLNHYGIIDTVYVDIGKNTYHERGTVLSAINISSGKLELSEGAYAESVTLSGDTAYAVSLVNNGEIGLLTSYDYAIICEGRAPHAIIGHRNTVFELQPEREGYVFGGWYTDKEFLYPYNTEQVTTVLEVYARWIEILPAASFVIEKNEDNLTEISMRPGITYPRDLLLPVFDGVTPIESVGYFGEAVEIKAVFIPDGYKAISADAFYNNNSLIEIKIPDSIKKSGANAFNGTALYEKVKSGSIIIDGKIMVGYAGEVPEGSTLVIREGVTTVADYALEGFSNFSALYIPSTLANSGTGAFKGNALKQIAVTAGNPRFTVENDALYTDNGETLVLFATRAERGTDNKVFSSTAKNVAAYAFYGAHNITEIALSDVATVGYAAFAYCSAEKITLGVYLTEIGDKAFYDSELSELTIKALNAPLISSSFAADFPGQGEGSFKIYVPDNGNGYSNGYWRNIYKTPKSFN